MEIYKKEDAEKIEANNQRINNFDERIASEKKEAKEQYQNKIADLNQKKTDLKKRMEDFKAAGKEDWDQFKIKFGSDMDTLGKAITNFFTEEKK